MPLQLFQHSRRQTALQLLQQLRRRIAPHTSTIATIAITVITVTAATITVAVTTTVVVWEGWECGAAAALTLIGVVAADQGAGDGRR